MIPFEQMLPEEQKHHLEETHGILDQFPDRFLAARTHSEDHDLLRYDHTHQHTQ